MTRRSQMEIYIDILKAVVDGKRRPTHIMYRANLSHQLLEKYLGLLLDKQLLQREDRRYYTTEKGQAFITAFQEIQSILDERTAPSF